SKFFTYVVQCMPVIAFLPDGSFGRIGINGQERFGRPILRSEYSTGLFLEPFVQLAPYSWKPPQLPDFANSLAEQDWLSN
ncbi:MAG: hypothetical protein WBW78_10780, partial [Terrimicrobiaceae bacterium]